MRVLVDPTTTVPTGPPHAEDGWSPFLTYLWNNRTLQVQCELDRTIQEIRARSGSPRTIIEIGTYRRGASLRLMAAFRPELYMTVSLPLNTTNTERPLIRRWTERQGIELVEIEADSRAPWAPEYLSELIMGHGLTLDMLMIDGDHSREGVAYDWATYGPLVRAGGVTVFHDVATVSGIREVFDEIQMQKVEVVADTEIRPALGLGIVFHGMELLI